MKATMKSRSARVLATLLMVLPLIPMGCKSLDVPDDNASSLGDLQSNPTPATIAAAATGIVAGFRLLDRSRSVAYTEQTGMMGRESYTLDRSFPSDPPRRLFGPKAALINVPSAPQFVWTDMYDNMAQEHALLGVVQNAAILSAQDKSALQGFIQTFNALDLLMLINLYDQSGIVIDQKTDFTAPPAPIASKAQTFARIAALLDSAKTFLQGGGAKFIMPLGAGFTGFDTPATFLKFNRAIKARVDVYMQNYSSALANLQQSFVSTSAPLTQGTYHAFSTAAGDRQNFFYDPSPALFFGHASIWQEAQKQADGTTLDARATAKVAPVTPRTQDGVAVSYKMTVYNSATDPIPIIRNEELILLRAEANLGCTGLGSANITCSGDPVAALADINFIRTTSGKLPAISPVAWAAMTPNAQLNELLYEKRYSLLWEGGHSWIDYRRYGKLAELPHYIANEVVFPYFPLIDVECVPRTPRPAGCTPVDGF
jgi:hypothetical protein